ncbi:MAG: hypothetical protein KC593_03585 [Myxococcales bacterium]|nr:hypothetical protein [Myxococcales bacterium]
MWFRTCPRSSQRALLLALTLCVGCDPCDDLDARICSDLGDDCAAWQTELAALRSSMLDEREHRLMTRFRTCSALADDDVYAASTLPSVQNAVNRLRHPERPQLPVRSGPGSGGGAGLWMFLPLLLAAAGYAYYYLKVMPKLRQDAAQRSTDVAQAQAQALEELRAREGRGGDGDA